MVFVFFGLVAVIGTTYVQTEELAWPALYAGVGIGALACAILVVNNLRDIPTDTVAGKLTLAVRLGDEPHPLASTRCWWPRRRWPWSLVAVTTPGGRWSGSASWPWPAGGARGAGRRAGPG